MKLEEIIAQAKRFLRQIDAGILSTLHSIPDLGLYPFGSLCPYVFTLEGEIALFISDIAIHTKNLREDPKGCMTIFESQAKYKQAAARLSVLGDLALVPSGSSKYDLISERYFTFFPEAQSYLQTHQFFFYVLNPVKVHYVLTFGKIYTFEGHLLRDTLPSWYPERQRVMDHMNQDHRDVLRKCVGALPAVDLEKVKLVGLDQQGFHLATGHQDFHYFPFHQVVHDVHDLRREFVRLAHQQ